MDQPEASSRFYRRRGSATPLQTAPVIWAADAGSDGSALFLADKFIIVGTKDGRVVHLDHDGNTIKVQQLPLPVKSLVRDGSFLYAWCPAQYSFDKWKGALYDLTRDEPRFLFDVENVGEWMIYATMYGGMLILGDDKGSLALLGANGEVVWFKEAKDGRGSSRMLLADESSIFFGHKKKVVRYSIKDGEELWSYEASGRHVTVHEGIQDEEYVYVEIGAKVVQLKKEDGSVAKEFTPLRHRASNVCIGSGYLITGSCPTILFDLESTEERYRMNFAGRLNDAFMKMHPSGRLFAVWDKIYCMDLTRESVQRAVEGKSTRTREIVINSPATEATGDGRLSATSVVDTGIRVECRQDQDGAVNVYPADTGFEASWTVRFPKALKGVGRKFLVDDLVAHENYSFYSVLGEIRELVSADQLTEVKGQEEGETQDVTDSTDAPQADTADN